MRHGVCIRVLGDLELLPSDVLEAVARAVNFSRNNDRAFLNVCFSYTSRHEMTEAIRRLARGAADGMIQPRYVWFLNNDCYKSEERYTFVFNVTKFPGTISYFAW